MKSRLVSNKTPNNFRKCIFSHIFQKFTFSSPIKVIPANLNGRKSPGQLLWGIYSTGYWGFTDLIMSKLLWILCRSKYRKYLIDIHCTPCERSSGWYKCIRISLSICLSYGPSVHLSGFSFSSPEAQSQFQPNLAQSIFCVKGMQV